MASDTPAPSHSPRQEASRAVQSGAQPVRQTVQQWTVAAILAGIIALGCYTLLLTWPLTQNEAVLQFGDRCENVRMNWYNRQIYGLVLGPCQNEPGPRNAGTTPGAGSEEGASTTELPVSAAPADQDPADGALTATETESASPSTAPAAASQDGLDSNPQDPVPVDLTALTPEDIAALKAAQTSQPGTPPLNTLENPSAGVKSSRVPRKPNALFIAVLAAGVTGGAVYSLRTHAIHVARRSHDHSWGLWNLTRPFLGGALAVFLFFLIRAGFVQNGQVNALRPEGFIALASLVGLFSDQAWARMRIVAESLFSKRDEETSSGPRNTPASGTDVPTPPAPGDTPRTSDG